MRKALFWLLGLYQRFFTLLSFGSCRYYPTCSEYAKWQIRYNSLPQAFLFTILRILRCNQLFKGGIDYPQVAKSMIKQPKLLTPPFKIKHIETWFVPTSKRRFFVIKSILDKNSNKI